MPRTGTADLPLHGGRVPKWLAERMTKLGGAIVEAIVLEYGKEAVLQRLSDPFWFQSMGAVMGMDWHSSGITTSVMGALKKAVNPMSHELGIYICGGRGKHSRKTPEELWKIGNKIGLDATGLIKSSRLSAKVDNTAIQDGFQLYLHSFILSDSGHWTVVQQGMNNATGMARRYHWFSPNIQSFVTEPHAFIYGQNQGDILNLTDLQAAPTRQGIVDISHEKPAIFLPEIEKMTMPAHHDVRTKDMDLKRLGAILTLAHDTDINDFESLLLLKGLGPRTLQSLTLVSEVIHGTPSRFKDPARFSFAHGGKDGHPFPVPTKVYDETVSTLKSAVARAKIGHSEKQKAMKSLTKIAQQMEDGFHPESGQFQKVLEKERQGSWKYGGRTVFGKSERPKINKNDQLKLF